MLSTASQIDNEGRRILESELRKLGWTYEDVSGHEGYDAWVCAPGGERKRVEVKSGKKGGWLHIDIRKAGRVQWNDSVEEFEPLISGLGLNPTARVTFDLAALTFDEVFVVRGVGSTDHGIY